MSLRFVIPALLLTAAFAATGTALPPSCEDPCLVQAATPGFLPPVASIESGDEVIFQSIDTTHPVGEAIAGVDTCFIASSDLNTESEPVTFTWDGSELRANGNVCSTAQALPTGEGMLMFQCLLHPTMVGTLVVT